jgi:tetratricopeptide (TPR) repeat protein
MRIGRLMGIAAVVALILGSFLNPENTVLDTIAFFAMAVVLIPITLDVLWAHFKKVESAEPGDGGERADAFARQLEDGNKALRARDFDTAAVSFEAAEDLIGGQLSVALAEAELYVQTGRMAEAIRLLEGTEPLHAGNAWFHFEFARALCLAGAIDRAVKQLGVALAIDPSLREWFGAEQAFQRLSGHPEIRALLAQGSSQREP